MVDRLSIGNHTLNLVRGDITALEVESFVYYARTDLQLGSGYGTAIAMRGGPTIQDELKKIGHIGTTEVVITGAGDMKADHILHAAGPRFQEENMEAKLKATVLNCLRSADKKSLKEIAFPAMGAGFYGISLEISARVTLETIKEYLSHETGLEKVVVCLLDSREFEPFQKHLNTMGQS